MIAVFRDIEGNTLPAPKARTLAAIKRSYGGAHPAAPSTQDDLVIRAWQYVAWMRGIDSMHRLNVRGVDALKRDCEFARASDGSKRVVAVHDEGTRYEIPHWDFVPSAVSIEAQGAFA